MARFEKSTQVDKKIYTRVKNVKQTIDNQLIEAVMLRGVKRADVQFEYEDLPGGGCCKQMKVTAYAELTKKRAPKVILDGEAD